MTGELRLALDGSTYAGSVAVLRGDSVIVERTLPQSPIPGRAGRSEQFLPMVVECLADAGVRPAQLAGVICGAGPGSFTSLRVAASIAKGIAVGGGCPLFAVSSLTLIVAAHAKAPGRYLAALPAMRGEVFIAELEVDESGRISERGGPSLVDESALETEGKQRSATVVGPAASPAQIPHAGGAARLLQGILAEGPCDIATWEPSYGRLAEAQVKWEAAHGRPLTAAT